MITNINEFRTYLESQRRANDLELAIFDYIHHIKDNWPNAKTENILNMLCHMFKISKNDAENIYNLWELNYNKQEDYELINTL